MNLAWRSGLSRSSLSMAPSRVRPFGGPRSSGIVGRSSEPKTGADMGPIGCGRGAFGLCWFSVGPNAEFGFDKVVGMPCGVVGPGRLPRIPPVPGEFMKFPPFDPGAWPSRDVPDPGNGGTLESIVGAAREPDSRRRRLKA